MIKLNRSFSRRIGKSLSISQKNILESDLPKYSLENLLSKMNGADLEVPKIYIAEIGIGMGDHFISRASLEPSKVFIGFDPYLNGIANSLKLAKDHDVTNIALWPDDVDLILDKLPDAMLSEVYILFPDPWPKLRHHKRRIINLERLQIIAKKLRPGGFIHFASDIMDYFVSAREIIGQSGFFTEVYSGESAPDGYIKTRYHIKSEEEGRVPYFLSSKLRTIEETKMTNQSKD